MKTALKIVFALATIWTIAACTASMNELEVSMDQSRKSMIGR